MSQDAPSRWSKSQTAASMARVRRTPQEARTAYDRMSRWYDLLAGGSEGPHVEAGLRKLSAAPGEQILDMGFGTGHALMSLAEATGPAGRAIGVDISEGMARVAHDRLEDASQKDVVRLVCGDGARLPLADKLADGIFMSFTLELFDTPRIPAVLAECRRVLRKDGRLCVVSLAKREQESALVRLYEWVHDCSPRYVDCRPIPVRQVLEAGGFRVVETERRSMWGLPVDVALGTPETIERRYT